MFKISSVNPASRWEAERIMKEVYDENPSHWPNGLSPSHFDDGLYLIREKQSNVPVGFTGFQKRYEPDNQYPFFKKVGYYSIGILPEYRRNGFAREAVSKIIQMKSAGVDKVRALIMSTNKPSQELAKDLGVDMEIKRASLWRRLGLKAAEPLLGRDVANLARQHGVTMVFPNTWAEDLIDTTQGYPKWLSRLGPFPRQFFSSAGQSLPRNPGVVVSPGGQPISQALRQRAAHVWEPAQFPYTRYAGNELDTDKLREAWALKDFIPKSIGLNPMMHGITRWSPGEMQGLQKRLSQRLGPNWILKERAGASSDPGELLTESSLLNPSKLRKLQKGDYMAQTRREIMPVNRVHKSIDDWLEDNWGYGNLNRGVQEFRVPVINNRIVPFATHARGSILGLARSMAGPWPSRFQRKAEALAQQVIDRMPANFRGGSYGFDIGIDKAGNPFLIEINPALQGGGSGFATNPAVSDAINSSILGRVPTYVKLRNALYGGGAGLGGLGAYGLYKSTRD